MCDLGRDHLLTFPLAVHRPLSLHILPTPVISVCLIPALLVGVKGRLSAVWTRFSPDPATLTQGLHVLQGVSARGEDEEDGGGGAALLVGLGELNAPALHELAAHLLLHKVPEGDTLGQTQGGGTIFLGDFLRQRRASSWKGGLYRGLLQAGMVGGSVCGIWRCSCWAPFAPGHLCTDG